MMDVHIMITKHSSSLILTSSVSPLGLYIASVRQSFLLMLSCLLVILWEHTRGSLALYFLLTSNLWFYCRSPSRVIFCQCYVCSGKKLNAICCVVVYPSALCWNLIHITWLKYDQLTLNVEYCWFTVELEGSCWTTANMTYLSKMLQLLCSVIVFSILGLSSLPFPHHPLYVFF